METQTPALTSRPGTTHPSKDLTGPTWMLLAICATVIYLVHHLLGLLAAAVFVGLGLVLIAYRRPFILFCLIFLVAPFNVGYRVGPAMLKLSELVCFIMAGLILWRVAVLDREVLRRLRLLAFPFALLTLLAMMATLTAFPHENFFNVRYEFENYIAFAFAVLFFKRKYWPALIRLSLLTIFVTAAAALILRFVFGLSAISFFSEQAVKVIEIGKEDIDLYAGGKFRLAGTFGHKNILAAYLILILPLIGMELFTRFRLWWLMAIGPALVTLALTDSMTGWGAALVIFMLMLLFLRRFDYLAMLLLLLMPAGAWLLYQFGEPIFFRIHQLFFTSKGWGTVSARSEIYEVAFRLIREHPWLGIGRNNFLVEGQTYYPHAHNLYLMKIIEMGIPAGFGFSLFVLGALSIGGNSLLHQASRLSRQGQYYRLLGLWLGCIGVFAMNLFDYSYSSFALGPVLMLCLGIIQAVSLNLEARIKTQDFASIERTT